MEIALVSGLFTILGAFIGALLARTTDRIKWLREQQSEVYAKFLALLDEAQDCTFDVLHSATLNAYQKQMRIIDAYVKPLHYRKIVRLYLPEADRETFDSLANEVWAFHSNADFGDARFTFMRKRTDQIQAIFERSLKTSLRSYMSRWRPNAA